MNRAERSACPRRNARGRAAFLAPSTILKTAMAALLLPGLLCTCARAPMKQPIPSPADWEARGPVAKRVLPVGRPTIGPQPALNVTLVSSEENTEFRVALLRTGASSEPRDYVTVGKGKYVIVTVDPRFRYDVLAEPEGYQFKHMTTLLPPNEELKFQFEISDKLASTSGLSPVPAPPPTPTPGPLASYAKPPANPRQGDSYAVIIGISRYQNSGEGGLSNLIYADSDAEAFADALRKQGWRDDHIKLLVNEKATQRDILIALESWLTKAGPDDLIVLFWSGHGYPDPEDPEKVYFACYDTDVRIPATGHRMDRVREILKERNARNVVILADTCHAGKIITRGAGDRAVSVRPYVEKLKRDKDVPKGWIFLVGAESDRLAIEHSSWRNGAFSHCLLKGLSGEADGFESVGPKDGVVTMGELRAYMESVMPEETLRVLGVAKRPMITTSVGDPDIWNLTLKGRR